jgi:hypothetical protein
VEAADLPVADVDENQGWRKFLKLTGSDGADEHVVFVGRRPPAERQIEAG